MPLEITHGASLATLNSFRVASRARRLVTLHDASDLDQALATVRGDPRLLVLGGGTNVLLAGNFDGTVLRIASRGRRIVERRGESVLVEAAAGENWHQLVCWTLDQGLSGLENLALIPGTVGASPIQNIGAYGVEMRERFDSLDAVDRHTGRMFRFGPADCRFGYRDSLFKHEEGARLLVVVVRFTLSSRFEPRLGYGELLAELAARRARVGGPAEPDAREVARAVMAIRRRKLPDPAVLGNAGSFFRNPLVEPAQAEALAASWPQMPLYRGPGEATAVKLSAGWLIERCGWKGRRIGDAGVHDRHALVLVNHGSATGAELLALADQIRDSVAQRFGVTLEPEPTIVR